MWVHFQKLCVCKTVNSHLKGICLILKHPLKSLEFTCATHIADDFHWSCLLLKDTFHHYSLSWPLGFNLRAVLDFKVFWGDGCCCCQVASVVSDSVQPHRRQPTRLPCPWDSPGKNTGVGCHFLLQCMKVKSESEVAQSCPTLSDPMDCSPPGSSVPGILQARALEWVPLPSPWGDGYSCDIVKGDKELDLQIFSIFWLTVAVSNTLMVKHWSEEVGKLGQQEGLLSKPYIWWSRTSPPMTREVPHFKYPHHQSNLPVTLEQFWHFKDLFLTFLSKCVSPLSHF